MEDQSADERSDSKGPRRRIYETYGETAYEEAHKRLFEDPRVKAFLYGDSETTGVSFQTAFDPLNIQRRLRLSTTFEFTADPEPPEGPAAHSIFLEFLAASYKELGTSERVMLDVVDAASEQIENLRRGDYTPRLQ